MEILRGRRVIPVPMVMIQMVEIMTPLVVCDKQKAF